MRRLELINLALLGALLAFALWAWPQLPERIPTHFNLRGEADAWSARSIASWFLLPGIAILLTLLLHVTARLAVRNPKYINIPMKSRLLELPPEDQQPILRDVQRFIVAVNTMVLLMFGGIQWATYRTALGQSQHGLLQLVLMLAVLVGPVLAIVITVRSTNAIQAAHRRAKLRGTLRAP